MSVPGYSNMSAAGSPAYVTARPAVCVSQVASPSGTPLAVGTTLNAATQVRTAVVRSTPVAAGTIVGAAVGGAAACAAQPVSAASGLTYVTARSAGYVSLLARPSGTPVAVGTALNAATQVRTAVVRSTLPAAGTSAGAAPVVFAASAAPAGLPTPACVNDTSQQLDNKIPKGLAFANAKDFYESLDNKTPEGLALALDTFYKVKASGNSLEFHNLVHYATYWGHSTLMKACGQKNVELVRELIAAGADVNESLEEGEKVLNWAVISKTTLPSEDPEEQIVKMLAEKGATFGPGYSCYPDRLAPYRTR